MNRWKIFGFSLVLFCYSILLGKESEFEDWLEMDLSELMTIKVSTATEHNGIIEFYVEDHGIGMPEAHLENIFNLSKSISRTGTNGEEGTGFGMSLIKSFVESYGGSITIESRDIQQIPQNHGTKVTIRFKKSLQP